MSGHAANYQVSSPLSLLPVSKLQWGMNSCRSFELLEGEVASAKELVLAVRPLLPIVVEHLNFQFQGFISSIELILREKEVIPIRIKGVLFDL